MMNAEEFVSVIKRVVDTASIDSLVNRLNEVNLRAVDEREARMLEWYNSLDEKGKEGIKDIISESVQLALFGFFCVLDGVRAIENGPDKGQLELFYRKGNTQTLLNDGEQEFLHDIYRS